jgi:hypothetical protein
MLHLLTQHGESLNYRRFRLDLLPEPDDLDPDDRLLPDLVDVLDELPDELLDEERTVADRETRPELLDDCLV